MKSLLKTSIIPLLIIPSLNIPAKAEIEKNSDEKVTVIELDNNDSFRSLYNMRFKPRENLRKDFPRVNRTRISSGFRKQKGDITQNYTIAPSNYGTYYFPHTTSLVKSKSSPINSSSKHAITSSKPYNASGKIYFVIGNNGYVCSGALIGKAVVSTAAHCLANFGGGAAGTASAVYFIPAATAAFSESFGGPIGLWEAKKLYIPKCYTNGNCTSRSGGVVNENDVALFTLKKKNGKTPYQKGAHYLNYGWNNVGFTPTSDPFGIINVDHIGQITTLGYPAALGDKANNRGGSMIRTDSLSFVNNETADTGSGSTFEQYYWGSGQSGGSSGSAVIINQGYKPNYAASKNPGKYSTENVVVSNISWGYNNSKIHVQGGSPFGVNTSYRNNKYKDRAGRNWGAGNIGFLMRKVCGKGYDNGQKNGICLIR